MLPLPSALIFDCDGTLVLSSDLHFRAFTAAFAAQGLQPIDYDFYHARGGYARPALIGAWITESGQKADIDALVQGSIEQARQLAEAGACAPNPPVAALARIWGARLSAVASNGEWPVVTASLRACKIDHLFDTVVTLDQVARPKPEPDMFLLAAQRLNTAAEDCLVLEDSAEGLAAAASAGMRSLDVRTPEALTTLAQWVTHLEQAGKP